MLSNTHIYPPFPYKQEKAGAFSLRFSGTIPRGPEETILSRQDYQNVRLTFRGKRFRIYGKKHIFAGGSERKDEA